MDVDALLDCFSPEEFDERFAADIADRQEQVELLCDSLLYRTAELRADIHNGVKSLVAAFSGTGVEKSELVEPQAFLPKDKGGAKRVPKPKRIDPQTEQLLARQMHAP